MKNNFLLERTAQKFVSFIYRVHSPLADLSRIEILKVVRFFYLTVQHSCWFNRIHNVWSKESKLGVVSFVSSGRVTETTR